MTQKWPHFVESAEDQFSREVFFSPVILALVLALNLSDDEPIDLLDPLQF
jgi:hypothetical protein